MLGPYVHRVDPVLVDLGDVYLWWYGLGFALGFLQIHLFLRRRRGRLGLTLREVYTLSLFIVIGVLFGGRLIEVAFDKWPFYRQNLRLIPAYWLGGMATHGPMLGAAAAVVAFSLAYKKSFLALADELVIPGAVGWLTYRSPSRSPGTPRTDRSWASQKSFQLVSFTQRMPTIFYAKLRTR